MELIPINEIVNSLPEDVKHYIFKKTEQEKLALCKMSHKQLKSEISVIVEDKVKSELETEYLRKLCGDLDNDLLEKETTVEHLQAELENKNIYIGKLENDAKTHNFENKQAKKEYDEAAKQKIVIFDNKITNERLARRARELLKNFSPKIYEH